MAWKDLESFLVDLSANPRMKKQLRSDPDAVMKGYKLTAAEKQLIKALLGRTVATFAGEMYAQFRSVPAAQCMPLPDGLTAREGAACFVNPLTALGMVETMRREGHTALVHTAAASNLGQMLNRICVEDGVGLVNIVRTPQQEELLRGIGAKHVCNSTVPNFMNDLTEAVATTGATLAFDAIGGGKLAGHILTSMEAALTRSAKEYSRYGSTTHKQVYIYGILDTRPTEIGRNTGMAWGVGGWLLWPFLQKIGPDGAAKLRERIVAELKTTFASRYARESRRSRRRAGTLARTKPEPRQPSLRRPSGSERARSATGGALCPEGAKCPGSAGAG